jgi:hypothetical protein
MMGLGVVSLIAKLHKWDESALFFDGSSLGKDVPTLIPRAYGS